MDNSPTHLPQALDPSTLEHFSMAMPEEPHCPNYGPRKARHQSGFERDLTLLHPPASTTVALTGVGCPVGYVIGGWMMFCVVIRQIERSLVPIKTKMTLCGTAL